MPRRRVETGQWAGIDEPRVLAAARDGDPDAIETLVSRHWDSAYRIGFLITRDPLAAEDIAQEATLSAVRALPRFDVNRPFAPWIKRIAANEAHDWVRRRSRRPEVVIDDEQLSAAEEEQLHIVIGRDFAASAVARALGELDLPQREAVVLRHLLDYEPMEIAEIVGAPAATVRTRIHRGLERLRAELKADQEGETDERAG